MTELKDYEKDVLEAIRTSRENGDTTITIKIHFNDKEADKISKSVTELEDKLKSTLDELSTHAQDIEEEADTCDCECDNCAQTCCDEKKDAEMEFEEHDSWPDTYDEMLADIYEHFDDHLTDIQAEIGEIHHNVDLMTKAIPESFDILEERLGVAPTSKTKKKDIKCLMNHIADIRHRLDELKEFALNEKLYNEDFSRCIKHLFDSLEHIAGEVDRVHDRVNDVYEAVFDNIDRQKAMEEKADKILALLQPPKAPAKKPATKKPAPNSDPNE